MAAPAERGSTSPVTGLSTTSPAGTQVGDLVIVCSFESAGATAPVHTLQSGFTAIANSPLTEASAMGQLSVAYKIATSSGATAYAAYTSSIGTTTWTGCYVFQAGTFDVDAIGLKAATAFGTSTGAPDPGPITMPRYHDATAVIVGGWRFGSSLTNTVTAPANYTKKWDLAGAGTGDVSLCTRAMTSPAGVVENSAVFTDNQTPTGNCSVAFWVMAPSTVLEMFNIDQFGSSTDAASYATTGAKRPAANSLAVLSTVASQASGADPPTVSSISGWGLTWELVQVDKFDSAGVTFTQEVWAAKVGATPPALGNVTVNYSGTSTGGAICIDNVTGITLGTNAVDSFKQKGVHAQGTSTSGSATLSALGSASNIAYASVHHDANETITPGAQFKILGTAAGTTPPKGLATEFTTNQTTCDASWTTSADYHIWAGEIAKVPAVTTQQAVAATTTVTVAITASRVVTKLIAAASTLAAAVNAVLQLWENSAEGGSDTSAVTTGNSGGASGKAWDTVNNGTNGTTTYDSSPKIENLSVAYAGGGSASINYLAWTLPGSITVAFARVYVNLTAPGSAYRLVNLMNGSTVGYDIRMQGAGGKFGLYANNALIQSASQTPSNGQWIRLELTADAATGVCTARIFYNPNATSPDETLTGTGATQAALTAVRFGVPTSQTFSDFNMDEYGISFSDWMGPGANVPGGTTPQSVAATSALTVAAAKRPAKTFAITSAATIVLARKTAKTVAGATTATAMLAKSPRKAIAAATTAMAAVARKTAKTIAAATTVTAALVRRVGKAISIVVALWWPGPILSNRIAKTVPVSPSLAAVVNAVFQAGSHMTQQAVAAAVTMAAAVNRRITKAIAVAVTAGIALARTKVATVVIPAAVAVTAAISRRAGKAVAVVLTGTAGLVRRTAKIVAPALSILVGIGKRIPRGVAVSMTVTAAVVRSSQRAIAVAANVAVAVTRRIGKSVAAAVSSVVALALHAVATRTIAAATTFGVSITRRMVKTVAAGTAVAAVVARRAQKAITVAGTVVVGLARTTGHAVPVTISVAVGLVRRTAKTIAASSPVTAALTRIQVRMQTIAVGITATISLGRRAGKSVAVGISMTVGLGKRLPQAVAVSMAAVLGLFRRVSRPVAAATTVLVVLSRRIPQRVSAAVTATISLVTRKVKVQAVAAATALTVVLKRQTRKIVGVGTALVVKIARRIPQAVAAGLTGTISVVRKTTKAVAVLGSFAAAVSRAASLKRAVAVGSTLVVGIATDAAQVVTQAVAVVTTVTVRVLRRIPQRITAVTAGTIAITRHLGRAVSVAAGTTVGAAIRRRVGKIVGVQMTVGAALNRLIAKAIGIVIDLGALVTSISSKLARGRDLGTPLDSDPTNAFTDSAPTNPFMDSAPTNSFTDADFDDATDSDIGQEGD